MIFVLIGCILHNLKNLTDIFVYTILKIMKRFTFIDSVRKFTTYVKFGPMWEILLWVINNKNSL